MRTIFSTVVCIAFLQVLGCDETELTQGKPLIEVEPAEVHFRTLNRLETEVEIIKVKNTGTDSLRIEGIRYEGELEFTPRKWGGADLAEVDFPDGIPKPYGTLDPFKELSVTFSPGVEGTFSGEVIITSNAKNAEEVRVPIDGECSVPDILVDPAILDFGAISISSTSSLRLEIKNVGEADLVIASSDFRLASGDDQSPFHCMARNMRIASGVEEGLEVAYSPKDVEVDPVTLKALPHEDILLVYSNDPDDNPVEVPLLGKVSDNLPPFAAVRVIETSMIDGTPLADPCAMATSDTIKFEGSAVDPEGNNIPDSNFTWCIEKKPVGSQREMVVPGGDRKHPTYRPDMYGDYTICVQAADPQGNLSRYDPDAACSCPEANSKTANNYDCPCIDFTAYPREDIRIELIWNNLGPDLDLHLLAPGANVNEDFCVPTQECRYDPNGQPWDRTACVESATSQICRMPNCDPFEAGCLTDQECYDDGTGPACWWQRCSGRDCYWGGRNPDWGNPGDESDDPSLDIDCTDGCRAENINLNKPEQGTYQILVNYYEPNRSWTDATVRIFFKGDIEPSAEFATRMWNPCDTWNVAIIEWIDPENHPVNYLGDSHTNRCCR